VIGFLLLHSQLLLQYLRHNEEEVRDYYLSPIDLWHQDNYHHQNEEIRDGDGDGDDDACNPKFQISTVPYSHVAVGISVTSLQNSSITRYPPSFTSFIA